MREFEAKLTQVLNRLGRTEEVFKVMGSKVKVIMCASVWMLQRRRHTF